LPGRDVPIILLRREVNDSATAGKFKTGAPASS
jgi:hypothetical protein